MHFSESDARALFLLLCKAAEEIGLYLGEWSTLQGLLLIEGNPVVRSVVAHPEEDWDEWARISECRDLAELIAFLRNASDRHWGGLIDFEVDLQDFGSLSTHDDGECHFSVRSEASAKALVQKANPQWTEAIWQSLRENSGAYLSCNDAGKIEVFADFDAYISSLDCT